VKVNVHSFSHPTQNNYFYEILGVTNDKIALVKQTHNFKNICPYLCAVPGKNGMDNRLNIFTTPKSKGNI
jgi:hypothetical protein